MTTTIFSVFRTFYRSFPFLPDSRVTRNDATPSSYNAPVSSLNFLLILILIKDKHCIETQAEQSWQSVSSSDWKRAIQSLWTSPFSDYPVIHWANVRGAEGWPWLSDRNQSPIFTVLILPWYYLEKILKVETSSFSYFSVLVFSPHL